MTDLDKAAKEYSKYNGNRSRKYGEYRLEQYTSFKAGASHILNSGDYIKRSEVVEVIEGIEYNPKDMEFEYYWHLTLAEILTKFKTK